MKYMKLLALSLLMVMGRGVVLADVIDISTVIGEAYLDTEKSVTTGSIKNNDTGGLGSIYKDATATFTLSNPSTLQDVYLSFMTATDNGGSNPTVMVNVTGAGYECSKKFSILNTGNWYFSIGNKHLMNLGSLPEGEITLKFTFDNESGYVGNLGNITFLTEIPYPQMPDAYISLDGGRYPSNGNPRAMENNGSEGGYKVGYVSNGASCSYDFYAAETGKYNLCMAMSYSSGGTMNVKITDQMSEDVEVDQDVEVTQDLAKGYGNEVAMLLDGKLTKGAKTLRLTFTTSGSWFMDFENLRLTKAGYTLNVSDAKAATLVLPFSATIPNGVKAYKLTAVDTNNKITWEEVTETLPANTPVLINAEKGDYTFEATEATSKEETPKAGLLTGVWEETTMEQGVYVLQMQEGKVAFYQVASDDIKLKANQAYLTVPAAEGQQAKVLSLDFGETTGIYGVEAEESIADAPIYDLQGKKVSKNNLPKVYIKNGKKYISK